MVENKEMLLEVLEKEVFFLEKEINNQLEKEYLKIIKLKKLIGKVPSNSISMQKASQKNKLEKRLENLIFMINKA